MDSSRRRFLVHGATATGVAGATLALGEGMATAKSPGPSGAKGQGFVPPAGPRSRTIISNDFGADPDGLFALVHHVLSPSTEVRQVIGAHALLPTDPFDKAEHQAQHAYENAVKVLRLMGRKDVKACAGSNDKLKDAKTPIVTAGAEAIVAEAMRTDTKLPLYITAGGTLTDVASAYLMEPKIADKATLVWIGGASYPDGGKEYNFSTDPIAAQVLFNDSTIPIWQIPSDVYGMCMVSDFELQRYVAPAGAIGRWLWEYQLAFYERMSKTLNFGEVYQLGDSPLVLLTALTSPWEATATYTSPYTTRYAPTLNADGTYTARSSGRKIRVYTGVDTRLMFGDFFAKLELLYSS
ncbi:nucleoside hydrolase [Streptomyces sp. LZ34]